MHGRISWKFWQAAASDRQTSQGNPDARSRGRKFEEGKAYVFEFLLLLDWSCFLFHSKRSLLARKEEERNVRIMIAICIFALLDRERGRRERMVVFSFWSSVFSYES